MTNMSSVKATALGLAKSHTGASGAGATKKKPKTRKRVNTAEKRASHNAVERQRRELLNGRFLDLARQLPSLAESRRPSKSAIVNASIAHLAAQREQRLLAAREMRRLFQEFEELVDECNDWRDRNGVARKVLDDGQGWTSTMSEVCDKVEGETFGTFAAGMGADGEGDDEPGVQATGDDVDAGMIDAEGDDDDEPDVEVKAEQEPAASALLGGMQAWLRANGVDASEFATVDDAFVAAAAQQAAWVHHGGLHAPLASYASVANPYQTLDSHVLAGAASRRMTSASASDASSGTSPSSTGSAAYARQPAVATYFGSAGAFAASPGSNGVMTPPLPTSAALGAGTSTVSSTSTSSRRLAPAQVATLLSPSPPPVVAPTSFSVPSHTTDEVHDWAQQQRDQMFQQAFKPLPASAGAAFDAYGFHGAASAATGFHGLASSLNAAHQTLLAHQPQLAAAVFPPPAFSASESPSNGGDDVAALLAAFPHAAQSFGATPHGLDAAAALATGVFNGQQPSSELDHWRKQTSASYYAASTASSRNNSTVSAAQPSMNEIRQALRAGMSMGMGLVSNWSQASSEPSPP